MEFLEELFADMWKQVHMMLGSWAGSSLRGMFDNVNGQIGLIGSELSVTPDNYSTWGGATYLIIKTISDDVILPIGTLIITALMCYELVNAVLEKNAMHDMGSDFIFRWLMRACFSVLLLSMTFDISMAIFDLGGEIASTATGYFATGNTLDDSQFQVRANFEITGCIVTSTYSPEATLAEKALFGYYDNDGDGEYSAGDSFVSNVGELLGIAIMALVCKFVLLVCYIIIQITLISRMIEIFMYLSVAPIPFATLTNREWGPIGTNYVKSLAALALQAFFIIICVGIYSMIIGGIGAATDLTAAMLEAVVACVALIAGLRGSKNLAMSIMNAH